jgi:hypothetical protein
VYISKVESIWVKDTWIHNVEVGQGPQWTQLRKWEGCSQGQVLESRQLHGLVVCTGSRCFQGQARRWTHIQDLGNHCRRDWNEAEGIGVKQRVSERIRRGRGQAGEIRRGGRRQEGVEGAEASGKGVKSLQSGVESTRGGIL